MKATVEELKIAKDAVEQKVGNVLAEFASKYGLTSVSVDFVQVYSRTSTDGNQTTSCYETKLKIGL